MSGGPYICPGCGKECRAEFGLTNHMNRCSKLSQSKSKLHTPKDTDMAHKKASKFNAFVIDPEKVAILLDFNFAEVLSEFILTTGCDNKAIMAFGHQLSRIDEEFDDREYNEGDSE